jgi:hypothetical protein
MSLAGFALSLGALACEAAFTLLAVPLIASLGARSVSAYACLLAVPLLLVAGLPGGVLAVAARSTLSRAYSGKC